MGQLKSLRARDLALAASITLGLAALVPSNRAEAASGSRPAVAASVAMAPAFVQAALTLHNSERARMGVAPLSWDPQLAQAAAGYAAELARERAFHHSPPTARPNQGENLWMGTRGAYRTDEMLDGWISEKSLYHPGVFPNVSRNGNWAAVGHYTQMVWRGSQKVGCAISSSPDNDVLVCRYYPAGNVMGRPAV